jgi:hypothetical protein
MLKHKLSDDVCTVAHIGRGQCRFCSQCIQWIACDKFDTECNPASHTDHKEDEDAT